MVISPLGARGWHSNPGKTSGAEQSVVFWMNPKNDYKVC